MNSTTVKIGNFVPSFSLTRNLSVAVVIVVLAFSLFFRIYALDRIPGVNGDEAVVPVTIHDASQGQAVVLRMPTGRMFSPVYASFSFVLNQILPPSLFALRLPSLLSGLLLIPMTFLFVFRFAGWPAAVVATLLVAVSPTNIAYARSGIEQAFTGLFGVLLCFAAAEALWSTLFLVGVLALVMHPTNVFYIPLFICIAGYSLRKDRTSLWILLLAGTASVFILVSTLPPHYLSLFTPSQVVGRLTKGDMLVQFLGHWCSLVSGVAAIEQFVGYIPPLFKTLWNGAVGSAFLGLSILGLRVLIEENRWKELAFVLGTFVLTLVYYLVSGNFGMEPGVLRYALVLLNPTLISIGILAIAVFKNNWLLKLAGTSVLFIFLFQVAFFFFYRIQTANSVAHATYKTGPNEPKLVAFQRILSNQRGIPTRVLVEDWWTFWPIRYLAMQHPTIRVELFEGRQGPEVLRQVLAGGGLAVSTKGGLFEKWIRDFDGKIPVLTSQVDGYGKETVLYLWASR